MKNWDDSKAIGMMEGVGVDVVRGFGRVLEERRVGVMAFWGKGGGGAEGQAGRGDCHGE